MSIASEITRISGNIADAYTALNSKGATLPAAGSQNSDNLANTIASVPAGGGGGFESFRQKVASLVPGTTCKAAYDSGDWFVMDYYKDSTSVYAIPESNSNIREGYYFGENCPDILYMSRGASNQCAFIVPEDAVVTELTGTQGGSTFYSSSPLFKIDFSEADEKWLIIPSVTILSGNYSLHASISATTGNKNDYQGIFSCVRYYCAYLNSTSYSESSPLTITFNVESKPCIGTLNMICDYSHILEDVDIGPSVKFAIIDSNKDLFNMPRFFIPVSRIVDVEKICSRFTNVEYGVTSFTGQKTNSALYYYANILARCRKFPFVLDGSGVTASSNTWYIGSPKSSGTSYSSGYPVWYVPEELFIIAPDMNINWTATDVTGNYKCNKISIKALKFLAEHSPNVSSRTLTIGDVNIAAANEADDTIITTLQSKGWTVQ